MNLILFDTPLARTQLLPLTFTRPASAMRVGILTIAEKWEMRLEATASFLTESYLQEKFPLSLGNDNLYVNGHALPTPKAVQAIASLKEEQALVCNGKVLALRTAASFPNMESLLQHTAYEQVSHADAVGFIEHPWHLFLQNRAEIVADFQRITQGRRSQGIADPHTRVYGEAHIFVEEGADIKAAVLNASADGPIYIGKNAVVQEGSLIKGAFALCEGAHVNMGGKMRGDSTIGPHSKVGGEVSNSILFGYSNKGHDGFIGNTVIGEWCNLGADTNTSNLKNNYGEVKLWSYDKRDFEGTGQQFCGLIMGDHAKAGINTMFNTGTVAGVCANIFGGGFQPTHIPAFAWGIGQTFRLATAFEVAERVMSRRKIPLTDVDKRILAKIFELTAIDRE